MTEPIGWIVRKTGVRRRVVSGDLYTFGGTILKWPYAYPSVSGDYEILSVTPIPTREEMEEKFEKCFNEKLDYFRQFYTSPYVLDNIKLFCKAAWTVYDDFIFGNEEEKKKPDWYDDWF